MTAYLTVHVAAHIIGQCGPGNLLAVNATRSFQLNYDVIGSPVPRVHWTFNGSSALQYDVSVSDDSSTLTVSSARPSHAGRYSLVAVNLVGSDVRHCIVRVQVKPDIATIGGDVIVAEGRRFTLSCRLQTGSSPTPSVTWYINGSRTFGVPRSPLIVRAARLHDSGRYSCVAANPAGSDVIHYDVHVFGVPRPPVIRSVTAVTSTSVTIRWYLTTQPPFTPIQHIVAQYRELPDERYMAYDQLLAADKTEFVVGGLRPSTQYLVRLAAVNDAGRGPFTADSDLPAVTTLPAAPSAPRDVTVTWYNATSATLRWAPPLATNGRLDVYQLMYNHSTDSYTASNYSTRADDDNNQGASFSAQKSHVTRLMPFTKYTFSVRAGNELNDVILWGDWSVATTVVTAPARPSQYPSSVTVNVTSSTTLLVHWQNLTSGVNGPLSGFIVLVCHETDELQSSTSVCQSVETTPGELQASVDDLHPWYLYRVRVAAVSSAGVGPYQPGLVVRTLSDAPSSAPVDVRAWTTSWHSVSVAWQPMPVADQNGPISGYIVSYRQANGSDDSLQTVQTNTTSAGVRFLTAATSYTVQVQGFTSSVDVGPFSQLITVTTWNYPAVWNIRVHSGTNWTSIYWSRPLDAHYLDYVVQYVVIISGPLTLPAYADRRLDESMTSSNDLRRISSSNLVDISTTFAALVPAASYNVSIAVDTTYGRGPFASITAATLPRQVDVTTGHIDSTAHSSRSFAITTLLPRLDTTLVDHQVTTSELFKDELAGGGSDVGGGRRALTTTDLIVISTASGLVGCLLILLSLGVAVRWTRHRLGSHGRSRRR